MIETNLFNGNCFDVLPTLPSSSVQLFLCDLPYGVLNKQNPHASWDKPLDLGVLWREMKRIGTPNCAYVFFASGLFTHDLIESNRKDFKYTLVWDKKVTTGFLNAKKQPLRRHEDIVVFYAKQCKYNPQFTKGTPSHIRGANATAKNDHVYGVYSAPITKKYTDDKYPTSILCFEKNKHTLKHPTEKPVSILEWLIKTYTDEEDMVCDPTMGSGSCGEACLNLNRKFIGIEMDEIWYDYAVKRLEYRNDVMITGESTDAGHRDNEKNDNPGDMRDGN